MTRDDPNSTPTCSDAPRTPPGGCRSLRARPLRRVPARSHSARRHRRSSRCRHSGRGASTRRAGRNHRSRHARPDGRRPLRRRHCEHHGLRDGIAGTCGSGRQRARGGRHRRWCHLRNLDVAAESVGVSITSSRCRVEDLTVRSTPSAVRLSGAQDCTLHRIEVHGGNIGLEISSSGGVKAQAVTVRGAEEAGLRVVGSWDCTLERVEVDHARVGISLEGGSRGTLLTDCVLESCGESGVVLRSSNDITLASSVIRDTPVGVALDQATDCEIRGCTIERPRGCRRRA